jgi:hypothetical protein
MGAVGQLSGQFGQEDDDEDLDIVVSVPGEVVEPEPDEEVAEASDADVEGDDEVAVDLDHWSDIAREAATERLRSSGVPHWWVGNAVHGAERDAAAIRQVLDEIEAEPESLDPDEDQVAYDMSEWDDDRIATLEARLLEAELPFGWDGDELFVYARDEDAVDELVEAVEHPDELPADGDDEPTGEMSAERLGEIFVAADRLQHDPKDHEQVAALLLASEQVSEASPPYGLAKADWRHLCERIEGLAVVLDKDEPDEEAVVDAARELRNSLRPYV